MKPCPPERAEKRHGEALFTDHPTRPRRWRERVVTGASARATGEFAQPRRNRLLVAPLGAATVGPDLAGRYRRSASRREPPTESRVGGARKWWSASLPLGIESERRHAANLANETRLV
jgi:hypothetical protein